VTDYDLYRAAIECGFPATHDEDWSLLRFAEIVMRAERESIAQDCERMLDNRLGHLIPDRIRLRGEP
jgi:hypothetical protein